MGTKFSWALGIVLALLMCAPVLAQQPGPYQPPPAYQQPPPQYQQPPPQYQQPPPQYQQPPPQYQQPAPQYQQPPPQYQQPPPQYEQPAPAYQQPPPPGQYQQPPYQQPPPPPPPAYQQPPPAYQPYQQPTGQSVYTESQGAFRYHPFRMQLFGGYTITQTNVYQSLHDGGSAGLGFTWFPSPDLPLGFRVDGSYSSFSHTLAALAQESANTNMNISEGYTDIYGGDIDAELDLPMGTRAKEYFFGGIGWYKERTTLKTVTYESGTVCYFYCFPAYFPNESTASRTTTDWMKSWNAGIGFEFALSDPATFFIDARFLRLKQGNTYMDFVPIRIGLRF